MSPQGLEKAFQWAEKDFISVYIITPEENIRKG